jgi:hypothetical protein
VTWVYTTLLLLLVRWFEAARAARPVKTSCIVLLIGAVLSGCCDIRWAIDAPNGPHAYTPRTSGGARFVLEVYERSNFDLAHTEIGQRFITMDHTSLTPIGRNYARSVILKASPNTVLEITSENGKKGVGTVGPARQLKVPDVCFDNNDGSYKTDGMMACRMVSMIIRAPAAR